MNLLPDPTDLAQPLQAGEGFCCNTQEQYAQMLCGHLPSGAAWPARDGIDSVQKRLMTALAIGFADIGDKMCELIDESDPCQAVQLLPDWERLFGLPDPCLRTYTPPPFPFAPYHEFQAGDQTNDYLYRGVQASGTVLDNNPTDLAGRQAAVCARAHAQGGASPRYFEGVLASAGHTITIEPQTEFQAGSQTAEYLYTGGGAGQFVAIHAGGASAWTGAARCLINRIKPAHLEAVLA